MSFNIKVEGGKSVRLPTAGKYCDRDILVTAEGINLPELSNPGTATDLLAGKQLIDGEGKVVDGAFTLEEEMTEQDSLIAQIKTALHSKASGGGGLPIQEKTAEATENGIYEVLPDDGYTLSKATVLVNVAGSGGAIVEGIPNGYAKVDYIKFSGSNSVDTGIICNQNTKIVVRYTRDISAAQYLYGVVNDGNTASVTAYLSSGGSWRFGSKSASRTITVDAEIIRTAIVQKSGIVFESGTNAYSGVTDFETPHTLILGGCHYSSGSIGAGFTGKVFGFEIWQGSELVLKLVPVVNADGEYRFWDQVRQTFVDTVQGTPLEGGNL